MHSGENINNITELEWITYNWHRVIISGLDIRGITSVAWWSCYLVRIRRGKPQS